MNSTLTRRSFLAATTAGAFSAASARRVWGANDRIRLGIIGTGSRGRHLMREANKVGGVEWVAVCDVWDERMEQGAEAAGMPVERVPDHRSLLDRADVDAVFITTVDHHHAHMTDAAVRAGKDVYVEKPLTSEPMQGHEVAKAVQETGQIVQVGMQQRSMDVFREAKERFVDSGVLGTVNMVRTVWNGNSGYLVEPPPGMEHKPPGLNWEAYLGWLPQIPWDPRRYFNRFAYWDISTGGQTGGLFVHMVDVVHWYLDVFKPEAAVAMGGIYTYDDGRNTPDNINLVLEYEPDLNVTFEATITTQRGEADIVFFGKGGRLSIFRGGYNFQPARGSDAAPAERRSQGYTGDVEHIGNWLSAVRNRTQPSATVIDGHYSSMACHLGNMAYQQKKRVDWDPKWMIWTRLGP